MSEMKIRSAEEDDLHAVQKMNEAAIPAVNHVSAAHLRELKTMAEHFVVTSRDGQIAGFMILMVPGANYDSLNYRWFSQNLDDFLYVDRIVIAPAFHRQGFGALFYQQAWTFAKQRATVLCCEVNLEPPNPQSMAFHLALGFAERAQQSTEGGDKLVSLLVREQ